MIYLDLGCHNGETIVEFFQGKFAGFNPTGATAIGIDPITVYKKEWEQISKEYPVTFYNKALFTHNGDIDYSYREDYDIGSSVMRDKVNYEKGSVGKVESVDVVDFIKSLPENEKIICRMDIEGAEYPVLRKLLDTGVIERISYIEVEFHSKKMDDKYKRDENRIIKELRLSKTGFKELFS